MLQKPPNPNQTNFLFSNLLDLFDPKEPLLKGPHYHKLLFSTTLNSFPLYCPKYNFSAPEVQWG